MVTFISMAINALMLYTWEARASMANHPKNDDEPAEVHPDLLE